MSSTSTARVPQTRDHPEMTSAALVAVAREFFARDGYAATSLNSVVAATGVTKGALYHHFESKQDLFLAVYAEEQRRLAQIVRRAYRREQDPWQAFRTAVRAFLEASLDPGVQRIVMIDAPVALGWETMREAAPTDSAVLIGEGLRRAMEDGALEPRPVDALVPLLFGAICEAARTIARSPKPRVALAGVTEELDRLLAALAAQRSTGDRVDRGEHR